jgi:hypothetical protein
VRAAAVIPGVRPCACLREWAQAGPDDSREIMGVVILMMNGRAANRRAPGVYSSGLRF